MPGWRRRFRVRATYRCRARTIFFSRTRANPRVTFTDPEIASVGLAEAAARARGIDVVVASADPAEAARGYIHDFHGGALELVGDREHG
jgi:pyruvate/2-oxoglutarate dehydrogenase complex dihydrolipoamide dehydrogenase (E3) component